MRIDTAPSLTSSATTYGDRVGHLRKAEAPPMTPPSPKLPTNVSYDFTDMTPREFDEALSSLYKAGAIPGIVAFGAIDTRNSPLSKMNPDGQVPPDANKKDNHLARLQKMIDGDRSRSDEKAAKHHTFVLNALLQVQGTLRGVSLIA